MYVRVFFASLFFLFSLSFAGESLKNEELHPNYKKTTLNEKLYEMESLELQFFNLLETNPADREPMIPFNTSRDCDGLTQDECVMVEGCIWYDEDAICLRIDEEWEEDECRYFENEDECLEVGCEWDEEEGCFDPENLEDEEGDGPPECVMDCEGVDNVDPVENGTYFCEWLLQIFPTGCVEDCEEEILDEIEQFMMVCDQCLSDNNCDDAFSDEEDEEWEDDGGDDGDFGCSDLGYEECLYYDFCEWISNSNDPTMGGQCVEADWDDGGSQGCDDGYVNDCSGDGDCCPESWVGDGFTDCEDQAWGCDLSCYDNDGGDCSETGDDGGNELSCSDISSEDCEYIDLDGDGLLDCMLDQAGNCIDSDTGDDSGNEGCDDGYVDDCSGDRDCCPESWIGDGFADCEDQPYGCDLSCYDNDGSDCGEYEVQSALILGDGAGSPGGSLEIPVYLESSENVAGIQFTLSMSPSDWVTVSGFSMTVLEDCFEANFNNTNDGTIAIIYSLSGCVFEASDESYEIAWLTVDLFDYAEWGGTIDLYFDDIVMSGEAGVELESQGYGSSISIGVLGDVNHDANVDVIDAVSMINFILMFSDGPTESEFWAADINSDGVLNILDVVLLVDMILQD